jgi:glucan biosynthesis protein C
MSSNSGTVRYHGLDGLRASMMLLGIYLHAAVAYSFAGGWPYKDERSLVSTFHVSLGLIHAFRMPVFMFMAGFFGALLYVKRGWGEFARNRAKRVLLPFVGGWLVLFPMVSALSLYGRYRREPDTWQHVWGFVASGQLWRMLHPMHLWFLEYLVLFYAIASVLGALVWPDFGKAANKLYRWAVSSPLRPIWFAVPTYFALIMMHGGGLDDPSGFMPELRIVLAYLVFFGAGWMLYLNADLVDTCRRHVWTQLTLVTVAVPFALWYEKGWQGQHNVTYFVRAGYHSVIVWCLAFALVGIFLRYANRANATMRYLSDASYFLYLVHMPTFIVFQLLLAYVAWAPEVKVAALLGVSVPVMLVMYNYWVRPGWLGKVLNGRRYDAADWSVRWFNKRNPATAPIE